MTFKPQVLVDGRAQSKHPLWGTYKNVINRCANLDDPAYGGRGIRVCDRWLHSFVDFLSDMGPKPSPEHSIERDDVNGNYEPNNCRWATRYEQVRNKQQNVFVDWGGERLCLTDWSLIVEISSSVLSSRVINEGDFYNNYNSLPYSLSWSSLHRKYRIRLKDEKRTNIGMVTDKLDADEVWFNYIRGSNE